jgi:hypothetical protein
MKLIFLFSIFIVFVCGNINGWNSGGQVVGLTIINNTLKVLNGTEFECSNYTDCFIKMCIQYRDEGYPNGLIYFERLMLFDPFYQGENISNDVPPFDYGVIYLGLDKNNNSLYPRKTCDSVKQCYNNILQVYQNKNASFVAIQFFNTTICDF